MTSDNWNATARTVLLAALAVTISGCGAEYLRRDDTLTTYAGDAVRRNIAVQTINPNPNHAYRNHIHTSGSRLEGAMARYNDGGAEAGEAGGVDEGAEPQTPPAGEEP